MSDAKKSRPKIEVRGSGTDENSTKTVRKSVLFLLGVAVVYALYLVFSGQLGAFFSALAGVDLRWVVGAMGLYVLYFFLGVTAYAIAVVGDASSPLGIADLMSVEATGIFFSHLTPNGTGGAPAQIARLMRAGLSVGQAGALQYTRFIIYEASEGIFAALMLIPRLGYFLDTYGNVFLVGILLFGAKIVEITGLLLVCLLPRQVVAVGNWFLRFFKRRGWLKRYDHWHYLLNQEVYEFSRGFMAGARNWRLMLGTLLVTLVQLGCQYALPWMVLIAFGRPADLVTCLACGAILELLTSAIPLPGGTGGAEGGFAVLFGHMFGSALPAGYVVWRMVEYVLPVLAAAPLMSLRTSGGYSINARIRRFKSRKL